MHWIERGVEPAGLERYRIRHTQAWIDHYSNPGKSTRPSDKRWTEFHDDLERVFSGLCGYCEEITKGVIDHFRPKKLFPGFTYVWNNWVFACHACNGSKWSRWPRRGYVDPCASSVRARPESYFEYDLPSLSVRPKSGISVSRRRKAKRMIRDLDLNGTHHLAQRRKFIDLVAAAIPADPDLRDTAAWNMCNIITARSEPLSSLARAWLRAADAEASP